MDVRPDEHAEDKAELHMFRCMVVSGALRGKLPENFLMVFNNLPHEIMLKIWSFLTLNERRRLRLVCKKWKSLWETSANRKLDLVSMKISSCDGEDNKIEIKCWSLARHHYLHQLVTTVSESSLDQLLSLVQLKSANGVDAGLKISVEGKVLPIVLTSVMKQGWTVSGLFLVGDMRQVTEDQFCSFIEAINVGNVLKKFQLMEASINSGFLTDRLISVLGTALVQFIVDISRSASNGVNLCSISNKSLTNLVKSGMTTVLPATPNISSEAVAAALVLTMEASADADTFITCPTEVYIEKSSNLDFLLIRDYLASKSRSKRHQGSDMKLWTVQVYFYIFY
ncbi:hypothetical protein AB6A40_001728 [Gnathostoma spinigerum]|uniref:F-box domain-containing protein n=1 Tax=Gnathostoma spinigerum TaxID=75299 RepID=A0ABD6ECF5_9BILA